MLIKTTVRWLKMIGLISLKHMPDLGIIQWIFLLDVKWPLDRNLRIQESTDQSWTTEGNNISKQKLEKGAHCSSLGLTWIQGNCATTAWTRYIYGAATWSSHPNFLKIQPLSSPKNTSSAPSPAISGVRRVAWLKQSDQKRRNSCPNSQHISFPGGFFFVTSGMLGALRRGQGRSAQPLEATEPNTEPVGLGSSRLGRNKWEWQSSGLLPAFTKVLNSPWNEK